MESQPLVSVITVCYNSEEYIEDTIKSALNQSHPRIEYIVVDGRSYDNTLEIVKEYEPKFEGRMRWISEPDEGIYDAMNKGIKMSTGDIVGILNSDDWYAEDAVETVVEAFNSNHQLGLVHGKMARYDEKGSLDSIYGRKDNWLDFADQAPFNHPTCFVRKEVYEDLGVFDTQYETAADYDFMLRVYKDQGIQSKYIPEILANFRLVGTTSNMTFPIKDIYKIFRKNGYSMGSIFLGIFVRLFRNTAKRFLNALNLHFIIEWYRSVVAYHSNASN